MSLFLIGHVLLDRRQRSTSIFRSGGLDETAAQSATLGMGAMNVAMTFVSLALIEKAGRKTLMVVGLAVMFVTTTLLMICLLLAVIATHITFNFLYILLLHM